VKALRYVRCHEPQGSGYYMHKQYRQSSLVPFPLGNSALAYQDYPPENYVKSVRANSARSPALHDTLRSAGPKSNTKELD
jgi:hypothetical protein